ncbi:hypothetical protein J1605_020503 [Eschrichtius robustus]|uniref:Uncharacterized protein n=1 Tax=Eschrichtius robustus TaxID=9764 RepID=A0AB34HLC8_ESCRO|nr:hypothetical protein J1605_020503 [Eschrichtius robustus]
MRQKKRRDLPAEPAVSARRGGHGGKEKRPGGALVPGGGGGASSWQGGERRERPNPRGCRRPPSGFPAKPGGAGRVLVAGEWGRGFEGAAGRGAPRGSDPRQGPPAGAGPEEKLRREVAGTRGAAAGQHWGPGHWIGRRLGGGGDPSLPPPGPGLRGRRCCAAGFRRDWGRGRGNLGNPAPPHPAGPSGPAGSGAAGGTRHPPFPPNA